MCQQPGRPGSPNVAVAANVVGPGPGHTFARAIARAWWIAVSTSGRRPAG